MTRPGAAAFRQALDVALRVDVRHDDVAVLRRDAAVDDEPVAGKDL
jgi:hypothetical protein